MIKKINVQFKCPYCENLFWQWMEPSYQFNNLEIIFCDCEDTNGCGRMFAVDYTLTPRITYYSMVQKAGE